MPTDSQAQRPWRRKLETNLPFAESPFLEWLLEQRPELAEVQREQVRALARDGVLVLPGAVAEELCERVRAEVGGLFRPEVQEGPASYYRYQDAWRLSPAVRDLALEPGLLEVLQVCYGRHPLPFQTLNFLYGTEQVAHSDAILFNTLPERFMCGVWVALEDVDADNGPLFYYPGSHLLPQYYLEHLNVTGELPDDYFNLRYRAFVKALMEVTKLERRELHVRRGDAVIWASNVVHGGTPRRDTERTRWSQVTHYFFEDCICYVPLYSNHVSGELALREVSDFRTGLPVQQTYNGASFRAEPVGGGRSRVVLSAAAVAGGLRGTGPTATVESEDESSETARAVRSALSSPSPAGALRVNLDEYQVDRRILSLQGWGFRTDVEEVSSCSLQLALASPGQVFLATPRRKARPDVGEALGAIYADAGFQVAVATDDLPADTYELALVLLADDVPPLVWPLQRTLAVDRR